METDFDEDTLRLMSSYCGGDPRKPRVIEVEVFSFRNGDECSLSEFMDSIASASEKIAPEYRDSAKVEMRGDDWCWFAITYRRPENASEIADNVKRAYEYALERRASERRQYEALKRKFG